MFHFAFRDPPSRTPSQPSRLAPTFMGVLKDRRSGATPLLALTMFDRRTRGYSPDYTLGRLLKGRTVWEQLKLVERPRWARGYKQMELEV